MKRLALLWFLFALSILPGITQSIVSGTVKDAKSGEPLPFATIGLENSSIGTITNGQGFFQLTIPAGLSDRSLIVSFLGYESKKLSAEKLSPQMEVKMEPKVLQLADVIVRPLAPEEYIRRAVRNIPNTLGQVPYGAMSYYREKFLENDQYVGFTEGVFKSFYPIFEDTIPNQYQLMLYETAENPAEIQFMKSTMEKKEDKKKKRAERKGNEYTGEEEGVIQASFGGPEDVMSMDLRKELEPFLDTANFKKFKYTFSNPVTYQDRELVVIDFQSKGKVEFMRSVGKIYLDIKSNAFVSIEYEGDFVIPVVVQPILFAIGIYVQDPYMKKKVRYQLVDGHWYPEYFYIHIDVGLEKRHMFSANEKSKFEIEQLLKVNEILPDGAQIPKDKRFDSGKDAREQIHNDQNLTWSEISTVKDEADKGESYP